LSWRSKVQSGHSFENSRNLLGLGAPQPGVFMLRCDAQSAMPHWCRNATMGSTFVARRAGI
jgi:hypothetical protein